MSNRTFLGKVGTTPKGEWSASVTYERLDWVTYQGSSYIALAQNTNSTPSDSNPNWMVAAKHGEFTEEQLEEFKAAVVADSKEEMDEYTDTKKGVLDSYTTTKEGEIDTYTNTKKGEIDTHTTQKISAFDNNATSKTTDFNSNATSKTNAYNQNAEDKTTSFNTNAANKQTAFNDNATAKTTAFDNNASSKTTDFNTNASSKTTAFNDNASSKTTDFNTNAQQKTDEFDNHVVELEEDNENLRNALPEVSGSGSNITLEGTSRNKYKTPPLPIGVSEQIQLTGKNKLNKTQIYSSRPDTTVEQIEDGIRVTGKWFARVLVNVNENTDYYLSYILKNIVGSTKAVYVYAGDGTTTRIVALSENGGVFNTGNNNQITICFYASLGDNREVEFTNIQLEEGSTATDYEPYCGEIPSPNFTYKQDIHNVSGNIVEKISNRNELSSTEQFSTTSQGMTFLGDGKGTYKISGTSTANTGVITNNLQSSYKIKNGDYLHLKNNTTGSMSILFYKDNEQVFATGIGTLDKIVDLSEYAGKIINKIGLYANSGVTTNLTMTPMILNNVSTTTPYIEHEEQTLPFTLASGQKMYAGDYLADDGIHHVRGEVIFDGSNDEDWVLKNADVVQFSIVISNIASVAGLCDKLFCKVNYQATEKPYMRMNNGAIWLDLGSGILAETTVQKLRDWLSENVLTVEYLLEQEVVVPYTPTQQAQYNAIKKAISYKEQTNITLTSSDADPVTNVVAVADMSNALNIINARLDLLED